MGTDAAFVCYAREDSAFVLRLVLDLKAAGASVWLDKFDIKPGVEWDKAVEAALMACPRMLLILSPASADSSNVLDEISVAKRANKAILPVLYRDCVIPLRVARLQYVDFRADYEKGLAELLPYLLPDPHATKTGLHAADAEQNLPLAMREPERRKPPKTLEVKTGQRSWRKVLLIVFGCVAVLSVLVGSAVRWTRSRQIRPGQHSAAQTSQAQVQTPPVHTSPPEPENERHAEPAPPQQEPTRDQPDQAMRPAAPASKIAPAKDTPKRRNSAPVHMPTEVADAKVKTDQHSGIPPKSTVDMRLRGLLGKSERDVLKYLGPPDSRQEKNGEIMQLGLRIDETIWKYESRRIEVTIAYPKPGDVVEICFLGPESGDVVNGVAPGMSKSAIEGILGKPAEEMQYYEASYRYFVHRTTVQINYPDRSPSAIAGSICISPE